MSQSHALCEIRTQIAQMMHGITGIVGVRDIYDVEDGYYVFKTWDNMPAQVTEYKYEITRKISLAFGIDFVVNTDLELIISDILESQL